MTNPLDILGNILESINFLESIDYSANNNKEELLDENTAMLDKGTDTKGNDLGIYKDISYKGRLRPVDLKDTGDFRRSFDIVAKDGTIDVIASDYKTGRLQDKYGDDILGVPLNDDVLYGILLFDIIKNVKQQIDVLS